MMVKYSLYIALLFFTSLAYFFQVAPTVTFEHFHQVLDLSPAQMSYMTIAYLIIYGVMQIPNGYVLDRFGLRFLPIYSLLVICGIILVKYIVNIESLLICKLLIGLGCSIAFTAGVFLAKKIFSQKRLVLFIALVSVSASIGAISATDLANYVLDNYKWVLSQYILISLLVYIGVSFTILCFMFYRNKPSEKVAKNFSFWHTMIYLFSNRMMLSIFIYTFFTWFVMTSFAGYWAKYYFEVMHKYSNTESLNMMQIYWISYLISNVVISYFMNSFRRNVTTVKWLAFINFAIYMFMLIPIIYNEYTIMFIVSIAGAATAGSSIGFSILSFKAPKEVMGMSIAVNNTFLVFGGLLGQLLFGLVVQSYHQVPLPYFHAIVENYYIALLLLPISCFIAFIVLFFMLKHKISD